MTRRSRPAPFLALLVIALTLAGGVACSQSPETKKQKAVERATEYIKDGKANEAVIELRNALQIDKDYVPALHALGRAYATKSWHADAARELGRAQQLAPDDMEITADLARSQVEARAWKQVEEQSDRILGKSPRSAPGLYLKAIARLGVGRPQEALALADDAAKGEGGLPPRPPASASGGARAPRQARRGRQGLSHGSGRQSQGPPGPRRAGGPRVPSAAVRRGPRSSTPRLMPWPPKIRACGWAWPPPPPRWAT